MSVRIQTDYNIGSIVRIPALDVKCRISMIRWDGINEEYYVSYWINGEYKQHWLHREDLQ